MLILPIVNRNRILNVEISLKNAQKIKTKVVLDNTNESDIVVDGVKYSTSVYNVRDASLNLVVDFIRNTSIKNKLNIPNTENNICLLLLFFFINYHLAYYKWTIYSTISIGNFGISC